MSKPTITNYPEWMSDKQTARYLGVSRDTPWRWTREGRLPEPLKIGPNCTRWKRSEIDEHLERLKAIEKGVAK